jgi:hypothetical protein
MSDLLDTNWRSNIQIRGIGTISVSKGASDAKIVKISLARTQDLTAFHQFLKLFGIEEAVEHSTPEELEKIKVGFLFKCFHPKASMKLQKDPTFAKLSLSELKAKMVALAPSMETVFEKYHPQAVELLPGYVRYALPIHQAVYAKSARALTSMITDGQRREFATTHLPEETLKSVANILKNGMFSEEMREALNISQKGIEGNGSVFTQIIWEQDIGKPMRKLGYENYGDVRLYFSLKALNRGSYQYNKDLSGTKKGVVYKERKCIVDFVADFPFGTKSARYQQEVMIPDRILPEEIQGLSVPTEMIRDQLIAYLRKLGLLQIDSGGRETINQIPITQFISIDHNIPADVVNRCRD